MSKKSKILLLALVLVLAFGQVAFAALTAVGPVIPDTDPGPGWSPRYNGFPLWYRDNLGQTVSILQNPPNALPLSPLAIPDPVILGNAFSAHIGFGSEAMYWHSTAIMPMPAAAGGGDALLVLALESAFAGGDAADGDQIVFQRIRIRIDTTVVGNYTVTTPYNVRTFTVTAADAGNRAINETIDIGAAPGAPEQALKGDIGPLLKQVGAAAGTLGDATTPAPVTNGPNGNIFRVQGPGIDVQTPLFVTGAQLFNGTPFTVTSATFTRGAAGTFAEVTTEIPNPQTQGIGMSATLPGQGPAPLQHFGSIFFGRIQFTAPFSPNVSVYAATNGALPFVLNEKLKDVVTIRLANYSLANKTLSVQALSTDSQATMKAFDFIGAGPTGVNVRTGGVTTTYAGVTAPPPFITVKSSSGGSATFQVVLVP